MSNLEYASRKGAEAVKSIMSGERVDIITAGMVEICMEYLAEILDELKAMNDNFVLSRTMNGSKCVINISQICRIEEHENGGTIIELSSGKWLTANDMTLSDWRKIIKGDGDE